ncbi:PAS domain-containing sensor histidine kinase [Thermophagus sp. OGC60D27]|uniref:PAS domain-containing sensor histidine kinase n=1 Tax=Thermophagus sp. OGC60D27 TaxID=3458415 RepID=UPI00403780D3
MIREQQLVKALNSSDGIIMITDPDGAILFVNEVFEKVYGYKREEIIGSTPNFLKSGFHPRKFYDDLWQTISAGKSWNGEFINRSKSGEIISEEASISPIFSEHNNAITGFIAIKFNISERKKLKEQLILKEKSFEKLFENSPVGIFILEEIRSEGESSDYLITRANLRASVIFNRISFIDQKLSSVLEFKNISRVIEKNRTVQHGEEISEWEDVCKGKMMEFKLFGIGKNTKCLLVSDISHKVKMESMLKENEARLLALNETKDKIFRIIAHDLRSPFQAIMGFAQMLNDEMDNFSQKELKLMASQIANASEQTYKLIDDLLTWSKSQLGQLSPVFSKVKVKEISEKVFSYLATQADKKKIHLVNKVDETDVIKADKDMVEFIIRNLVHNGIKFSLPGGEVCCSSERDGKNIKVHIKDNGIGIQADKLEKIFSLSGNLSTKGTSEEAGTGLGLMLSSEMAELNYGNIEVQSEPGKGSQFTIVFPAASL